MPRKNNASKQDKQNKSMKKSSTQNKNLQTQKLQGKNLHSKNTQDKDLQALRSQIDTIDEKILSLLESRLHIVTQIGKAKIQNKASIYRPEREREIIKRLSAHKLAHLNTSAIEAIYHEIFAISRNLELPEKVAYLGPLGSYTHQAAAKRFGALSQYLPINNISAIFKTLQSSQAKYGVVPIENNTNGVVGETIDNLANSSLKIIAEIILPIHHSFASLCENLSQIKRIYSKDIAFGQCDSFINAHNLLHLEQIPTESTAKAAQLAKADKQSAAICSQIAAKIYEIPIMFSNVQNHSGNKTRFVIISDFSNERSGNDKTSIFATLKGFEKSGTLLKFLKDFEDAKINLTKIDSRPVRSSSTTSQSKKGDFSSGFYIDFDGHRDDEKVAEILEKWSGQVKWLGSYPKMD